MRLAAALGAALLLAGCAASRYEPLPAAGRPVPSGPSSATVVENRTFRLSKTPDPQLEMDLPDMLSASYSAAAAEYSGGEPMKVGFTYSLSPKGAIYPFSEVEVSCIVQHKYAGKKGPELCADFFSRLESRINKALELRGEIQQEEE